MSVAFQPSSAVCTPAQHLQRAFARRASASAGLDPSGSLLSSAVNLGLVTPMSPPPPAVVATASGTTRDAGFC